MKEKLSTMIGLTDIEKTKFCFVKMECIFLFSYVLFLPCLSLVYLFLKV